MGRVTLLVLAAVAVAVCRPARADEAPAPAARLTLAEAVERALAENPDARALEARVARQSADVRVALAGVLPSLGLTTVYTHHDQGVDFGGSSVVPEDELSVAGELSLTLLRPRALGGWLVAREDLAAVRTAAEFDRQTLALSTVELYLGVLRAAALAEAAAKTVERRGDFLAASERRLERGISDRSEVQRARLSLLEARAERARLDAERDVARVALGVLLRLAPETRLDLVDEPGQPSPRTTPEADPTGDPARRAADRRLDVRALRRLLERDAVAGTWAWLDFLPDLELAVGFTQGPSSFRDPDGFSWQIQLRAVFALYDGGARYGRLDQAAAVEAFDEATLAAAEDDVARETRTALLRVAQLGVELNLAGESAELAAQVRSDVERRLEAGLDTLLDVLDAEDRLALAELRVRSLAFDLRIARWRLAHAGGTLLETLRP